MTTQVLDKEFNNPAVNLGDWIQFQGGDIVLVCGVNDIFTRFDLFSVKDDAASTATRENDGGLSTSEPYRLLDVAVRVIGTKRPEE
ncbi:hypothetical protein ACRYI5_00980 [Furfurilactobacillus sp. WILCCON 0119]